MWGRGMVRTKWAPLKQTAPSRPPSLPHTPPLTASTNPQLATGPQKWVVRGPVGELMKVFRRVPSDAGRAIVGVVWWACVCVWCAISRDGGGAWCSVSGGAVAPLQNVRLMGRRKKFFVLSRGKEKNKRVAHTRA